MFKPFVAVQRYLALLCAIAILAGCAPLRLVGNYDEQIDRGTTALQRDVETFLVNLERSAAKPADLVSPYSDHKAFYDSARVSISSLRLRADATERNSLTVRAFDKLAANLSALESMHKVGITQVEISKLIRPGFTSQFTAILAYELAKRRSAHPDETTALAAPTPLPSE